jgi:hypothetical protein
LKGIALRQTLLDGSGQNDEMRQKADASSLIAPHLPNFIEIV